VIRRSRSKHPVRLMFKVAVVRWYLSGLPRSRTMRFVAVPRVTLR
jgi:hypothetical protein